MPDEKKEKALAKAREWKAKNKAKVQAYRAAYWEKFKSREIANREVWKETVDFESLCSRYNRNYRDRHSAKISKKRQTREYKDKVNKRRRERYASDPVYRTQCLLRALFRQSFKLQCQSKIGSFYKYLGCTVEKFNKYLSSKFLEGMSWANHGKWHIDHIKPCAEFDFSNEQDIRKCYHFTNMQPLWAKDNQSKHKKSDGDESHIRLDFEL